VDPAPASGEPGKISSCLHSSSMTMSPISFLGLSFVSHQLLQNAFLQESLGFCSDMAATQAADLSYNSLAITPLRLAGFVNNVPVQRLCVHPLDVRTIGTPMPVT
jgi:hypothetical protein